MTRPPDVFLIAHPRSGTHALASLLAANSDLTHLGEVFNVKSAAFKENYYHFIGALQSPHLALPQNAGLRFWTYLDYLHRLWPDNAVVLDIKYDVLHLFDGPTREPHAAPQLLHLLREAGAPVIHLKRNPLHLCFSHLNAVNTQQWHVRDGVDARRKTWSIDTAYMMAFLYQKTFEAGQVSRYVTELSNTIELDYDRLFATDGTDRQRLFDFLGLSDRGIAPSFKKQIDRPYAELIENYEEALEAVRKSPFRHLLSESEKESQETAEESGGQGAGDAAGTE